MTAVARAAADAQHEQAPAAFPEAPELLCQTLDGVTIDLGGDARNLLEKGVDVGHGVAFPARRCGTARYHLRRCGAKRLR